MDNIIKPAYPEVKSSRKINWIYLLIPIPIVIALLLLAYITHLYFFRSLYYLVGVAFWPWVIYYLVKLKKAKKQDVIDIQNSSEYINTCRKIDNEYEEELLKAKIEHEKKMDEYNKIVVVEYNKNFDIWKVKHEAELKQANAEFTEAETKLNEHYNSTQLIPIKYHDISILEYIYGIINSSQYSFKEAAEDDERDISRQIEIEKINQQRLANDLAEQQAMLTEEQNSIAEKMRRDQNIAAVVGTVQRHNTNKFLKKLK